MSWSNELYKIYEKNYGLEDSSDEPLLPIYHSTAQAQIEVTINDKGDFVNAYTVDKNDSVTLIPVTEESGARTSGVSPHPLADNIKYVAGDCLQYGLLDNSKYYDQYISQLKEWAESDYSHDAVVAVLTYLQKGTLIGDLISSQVVDLENISTQKINGIDVASSFIRFRINYQDIQRESRTWCDKSLCEKFIEFNEIVEKGKQLCYATGEEVICTYKHPSKIRNAGDMARLISSNDESGYSYRGRFFNKEQAISVGYGFSQKVHNALKWLIKRQGTSINSMTYLLWESELADLPDVADSSEGFIDFDDFTSDICQQPAVYRTLLKKSIFGYKSQLAVDSKVMFMALDSATPGRISISAYTELAGSDFLDNMEKWHEQTAWNQLNGKLKKTIVSSFSLRDIANKAFGMEQGKFIVAKPEVVRETLLRLVPCVIEGRHIPADIVNALYFKASNPLSYAEGYNFRSVLECACGLIRKQNIEKRKGEISMSLNLENTERSYLFGRLLAVADKAEQSALDGDANRQTNAKRYWSMYSQQPYRTWQVIEERLRPYLDKLGIKSIFYTKIIDEILSKMSPEDFSSKKRLSPDYLLGYHCQMNEFYRSNKQEEE